MVSFMLPVCRVAGREEESTKSFVDQATIGHEKFASEHDVASAL